MQKVKAVRFTEQSRLGTPVELVSYRGRVYLNKMYAGYNSLPLGWVGHRSGEEVLLTQYSHPTIQGVYYIIKEQE